MQIRLEHILSIPKSLYVCLRLFPIKQALKLPLVIRFNTKVLSLAGKVKIDGFGRVRIGFGHVSEFDSVSERSIIHFAGNVLFHAPIYFGTGAKIVVERGGVLEIGQNFVNTARATISCRGTTSIGDNCLVSWNTWISDTDFHKIRDIKTGELSNPNGIVSIGNDVWLCSDSSVLKDSIIPDGCIVASKSLVNKPFNHINCLLAGIPAKVHKENVSFDK